MKRTVPLLALALCGWLITGCASVPSGKISINPTNGVITVDSPKDVDLQGLEFPLPTGVVKLQSFKSHNSPEVLATVAAANAQMADKMVQMLQLMQQMGMKAATSGVAP